jgi:hypothetical protein
MMQEIRRYNADDIHPPPRLPETAEELEEAIRLLGSRSQGHQLKRSLPHDSASIRIPRWPALGNRRCARFVMSLNDGPVS